jgi:hypothetical protein
MSTDSTASKRPSWQTWVGSLAGVGTLLLAFYTYSEQQSRYDYITQRNEQQRAICDNVNKLADVMDTLVRDAVTPLPGQTEEVTAASTRYKENAVREIRAARCSVKDVNPDNNPLGLWLGGNP